MSPNYSHNAITLTLNYCEAGLKNNLRQLRHTKRNENWSYEKELETCALWFIQETGHGVLNNPSATLQHSDEYRAWSWVSSADGQRGR